MRRVGLRLVAIVMIARGNEEHAVEPLEQARRFGDKAMRVVYWIEGPAEDAVSS